jgi:hypothetical protein
VSAVNEQHDSFDDVFDVELSDMSHDVELADIPHPADRTDLPPEACIQIEYTPSDGDGLGDDWWNALPQLAHIRKAARARRVAPTSVLGAVLARVAAFTPPSYCVPPFVGGTVPLSLIVACVGKTSDGKSVGNRVAAELIPCTPPGTAGPLQLGSGEGAAEAFLERYTHKDDTGRNVTMFRQINRGVLFGLDEGRVLSELGSRSGSTIIPTLCTMWTGGDPGRQNASAETRRSLPEGGYSFGLISMWQTTLMQGLFDDTDGGLPGRFVFLGVTDPEAPDIAPDWPGPLDWTPPPVLATDEGVCHRHIGYPATVADEVDAHQLARLKGAHLHPLDGHRMLNRLKVAGILAMLDTGPTVEDIHWQLAGQLIDSSDRIRADVLRELSLKRRDVEEAGHARAGRRKIAEVDAVGNKALNAAVNAVTSKAHRSPGEVISKRDMHHAIRSTDRKIVGVDPALEEADRLGYIVAVGDGWIAGESRPAP